MPMLNGAHIAQSASWVSKRGDMDIFLGLYFIRYRVSLLAFTGHLQHQHEIRAEGQFVVSIPKRLTRMNAYGCSVFGMSAGLGEKFHTFGS